MRRSRKAVGSRSGPGVGRALLGASLSLAVGQAFAMEIDTGNPDVATRWDTTVKYSAAARVKERNPGLLGNPNFDDGDRNFGKGLISSRVDLLSELDVTYKKTYGFRLSGAAWYDQVYNRSNDNPGFSGGAFPNQTSAAANEFPAGTRKLHGNQAELLDAFVFGKFDLDGHTATVRAGRHSILWGESLFLGQNAIAGGQMPVDAVKLMSVPNTQFKEAIHPVQQVSGQIQINSTTSLGAYYQTKFAATRIPAIGSYFSNNDVVGDGAENLLLGPSAAPYTGTLNARNSGQGGLQLRYRSEDTDYGFYAIRFHSKIPQQVTRIGIGAGGPPPGPVSYYLAYHEGVNAFGASASKTFGDYNVAIEASMRTNQDLASSAVDTSALGGPVTDNNSNPAYAVGRTAHMNLSMLGNLGRTFLWREATIAGELAWNRVLSITKNPGAIDPNGSRDGLALRVVVEPTYRQVLSGLDIGVPVGIGYAPKGSRPLAMHPNSWIPEGGGDLSIGINGNYLDAWRFSLSYTHYYGALGTLQDSNNAYTYKQTFKDRDYVALSLNRTF